MLEVTTGNEALQLVNRRNGAIDLFVSDVTLPDLSGTGAGLRLIQARPGLRILLLPGTPMNDWCESDLRISDTFCLVQWLFSRNRFTILDARVESLVNSHARVSDARR
jgi:hypothetical protein